MTNPYLDRLNALQGSFQQRSEIIRVNGKNGAEAYPMPQNSSVLLLDETNPIVWLKTTDGAGYATLKGYSIAPLEEVKPVDAVSLEQRIQRLEDIINGKSDTAIVTQTVKPNSEPEPSTAK